VLDHNTGTIRFFSKKELSLGNLIGELEQFGTVTVIATDRRKAPYYARSVAVKLGAVLFTPKDDIMVKDKIFMTRNLPYRNSHERDAGAAAITAYNHYRLKIDEINSFLVQNGKEDIADAFIDRYMKNDSLHYHDILRKFEPDTAEPVKIDNKQTTESDKDDKPSQVDERNSLIRMLQRDNQILQKENSKLRDMVSALQRKQPDRPSVPIKTDKYLMNLTVKKEKRFHNLLHELTNERERIRKLNMKVEKLLSYLMASERYLFIPYQDDLKAAVEGKMIFVKDANIFISPIIERISHDSIIISCQKPSDKLRKSLQCTLLYWNDVPFEIFGKMAAIGRSDFQKKLDSLTNFESIVNDYREKRKNELSG